MYVRDWMNPYPIAVSPTSPVSGAKDLMRKAHVRHLLVTRGDHLVGIITDRDIRLTLPSPATSLSVWEIHYLLAKLTVGEVMTKEAITVTPRQRLEEAIRLMLTHAIGALPVIEGRRVVGIITETDLLRAFAQILEGYPESTLAGVGA